MPDRDKNRQDTFELLEQFQAGDEQSAALLFERYMQRLTALARVRMSQKLAVRVDPDDVVMSAWRSFFVGARSSRFSITDTNDLWSLLVTITLRKLYRQASRHTASSRSVDQEAPSIDGFQFPLEEMNQGPSPDAIVAASDLLEFVMSKLSPPERYALELRLQGSTYPEIAAELSMHERTVRRWFERIRELLCEQSTTDHITKTASDFVQANSHAGDVRDRLADTIAIDVDESELLDYSDYLLVKHVGAGRTGKVFIAKHQGRRLAIKFLRKSFQSEPKALQRFVAEAQTLMSLQHPHVVKVEGLGKSPGGGWFIVMEYLTSGDLSAVDSPVPFADIARWIKQTCLGIKLVHSKQIFHCDIKPANLLLDDQRCVRVCDFGLARQASQRDVPMIAGTPAFMAPEQIADCWGEISTATDVYGIGATMFALLTGRPPFNDASPLDMMARIVSRQEPPLVRSLRSDCSENLELLCRACLAKEPAKRPSIESLLASLERF